MCNGNMEVYSRIVGYFRPIKYWNAGKTEEWKDRKFYATGERNESDPRKNKGTHAS